jgi:hypothetical protein
MVKLGGTSTEEAIRSSSEANYILNLQEQVTQQDHEEGGYMARCLRTIGDGRP